MFIQQVKKPAVLEFQKRKIVLGLRYIYVQFGSINESN